MSTETKKARPVAEIREGFVKIPVWKQQGPKGVFFTAGVPQLSYKDDAGNWQEAGSYGEHDIVDLMIAAGKAKSKIRELRRASAPPPVETAGD